MGTYTSGRVGSNSTSYSVASNVKKNRMSAGSVADVKKVSSAFNPRQKNSAIAGAYRAVNSPDLGEYFAGAYPGGKLERADVLSTLLSQDNDVPAFVDFLAPEDLIAFSAPLDGPDLIDFSDDADPNDLIEWREVGATKEIGDEEFELDELMADNPNTQDRTEMRPAGAKGYLQFDASGQIADAQSSVEKTMAGQKSSFEEMMAEIARESARLSDAMTQSSPELMSPIDSEVFPDVPWDIFFEAAPSSGTPDFRTDPIAAFPRKT